jgi:hypothetical protein
MENDERIFEGVRGCGMKEKGLKMEGHDGPELVYVVN